MSTLIQWRRGTAVEWLAANPVLAPGEIGVETDTGHFKSGDGINAWSVLSYSNVLPAELLEHTSSSSVHGVGQVAGVTETQTLANKTLASPVLTGTTSVEVIDLSASKISTGVMAVAVATPVLIDSFVSDAFRSAEYTLQLTQGSSYAQTHLVLLHNNVDVAVAEYGTVSIGTDIPFSVAGNFSSGNLELTLQCATATLTPVSLKFTRTLFDA